MPKLSVCIPAYNQTTYLRKCIDSILNQDYTDYELIITDDSPGNIVQNLIQEYNLPDKIHYYKNPSSLGSPRNWNTAVQYSSGEYIKIIHHDDWLNDSTSLTRYVHLLDKNPDADLAFSATRISFPDGREEIHLLSDKDLSMLENNPLILYSNNMIGAPSTTIYRRTHLLFNPDLKWLVDIDFYIRMLNQTRKLAYSKELLVTTCIAEERVTNQCLNNKDVEIPEYLSVLSSIYASTRRYGKKEKKDCLRKAIQILEKHNIDYNHTYIKTNSTITAIQRYFFIKKFSPLGARIVLKLL